MLKLILLGFGLLAAVFMLLILVYVLFAAIGSANWSKDDSAEDESLDYFPKTSANKISENKDHYKSVVRSNKYNLFDFFNIHPGNSRLGEYGEFLSMKEIVDVGQGFDYYYKIASNVHIGVKTEIDLVWIHETGIYVIESKNYSGWIYGDLRQRNWTKTFPKSKEKFYNPIWQNNGHISALQKILGNSYPYISVIVFSERCELKSVPENTNDRIILKRNALYSLLRRKVSCSPRVISMGEIDGLYKRLLRFNNTSPDIQQKHNDYVHHKQHNRRYSPPTTEDDDDLPF